MDFHELLPLAVAARTLPRRNGKPIHPGTLARWAREGLRDVRLPVTRVGGRTYTSVAALRRFFSALDDARGRRREELPQPAESTQGDIDVGEELDRHGL